MINLQRTDCPQIKMRVPEYLYNRITTLVEIEDKMIRRNFVDNFYPPGSINENNRTDLLQDLIRVNDTFFGGKDNIILIAAWVLDQFASSFRIVNVDYQFFGLAAFAIAFKYINNRTMHNYEMLALLNEFNFENKLDSLKLKIDAIKFVLGGENFNIQTISHFFYLFLEPHAPVLFLNRVPEQLLSAAKCLILDLSFANLNCSCLALSILKLAARLQPISSEMETFLGEPVHFTLHNLVLFISMLGYTSDDIDETCSEICSYIEQLAVSDAPQSLSPPSNDCSDSLLESSFESLQLEGTSSEESENSRTGELAHDCVMRVLEDSKEIDRCDTDSAFFSSGSSPIESSSMLARIDL